MEWFFLPSTAIHLSSWDFIMIVSSRDLTLNFMCARALVPLVIVINQDFSLNIISDRAVLICNIRDFTFTIIIICLSLLITTLTFKRTHVHIDMIRNCGSFEEIDPTYLLQYSPHRKEVSKPVVTAYGHNVADLLVLYG